MRKSLAINSMRSVAPVPQGSGRRELTDNESGPQEGSTTKSGVEARIGRFGSSHKGDDLVERRIMQGGEGVLPSERGEHLSDSDRAACKEAQVRRLYLDAVVRGATSCTVCFNSSCVCVDGPSAAVTVWPLDQDPTVGAHSRVDLHPVVHLPCTVA